MKQKLLLVLFFCFAMVLTTFAQDKTVKGKVTDSETGEGLPGVNVIVKGTQRGTVTDVSGNYEISVPQGAVLVFKAVGMQQKEVVVGGQSELSLQLIPDTRELGEVVIQGYSIAQERRQVTGAVTTVGGQEIENLPLQSFDRAIQGRMSGVQVGSLSGQPGGAVRIRVRGIGSVNAGNDPLYIVDGVQIPSGGLSGQASSNILGVVNPNDIESIQVLKDASSAAIYGAQAANGVVIITTKKGKAGEGRLRVNAQWGSSWALGHYDIMNSRELAEINRVAYTNAGLDPAQAAAIYGSPDDANLPNYDWIDAMFRNAPLSNYDVSLSGGDDKTTFFLSTSYNAQEGIIRKSNWERFTGRLNLTSSAVKNLLVSASIGLTYQDSFGSIANGNFVNSPFVATYEARPNSPAVDENGNFNPYPLTGDGHLFGYNIFQGVEQELREAKTMQAIGNLSATYTILPELTVTAFVGVSYDENRDKNVRPSSIPVFAAQGGSGFLINRRTFNLNTNYNLNYNKVFADVHTVSAVAGFEYKNEVFQTVSASGQRFLVPEFNLIGSLTNQPTFAIGEALSRFQRAGVFGKVGYSYKDKYLADFTLRTDGHSRFSPDTRWGTFYAFSAGWRISSESFMQGASGWLDDLKLRVGYGLVGNSQIANYPFQSIYSNQAATRQYLSAGSVALNRIAGASLAWEESEQINAGIDFTVLKGRISGSVDFWRNNNKNLLFARQLPFDSGFGSITSNVGKVRNQGIDIEISTNNINSNGFTWRTSFNITFQQNRLIALPDGLDRIGNALIVGEPITFFYGVRHAGVNPADGRYMFYDIDGNLTYRVRDQDQQVIGNGIPTYFGGITNTFNYKGITLEIFFQYQGGNVGVNQDIYNLQSAGNGDGNQDRSQLAYWRQPGDITNVPAPHQGGTQPGSSAYNTFSDRILSDGSYLRLKQVTLSYTIPQTFISKIGVRDASIFVQGLNLLTFTKFNGIDPEVLTEIPGGTTFGAYPNVRQVTGGVSVTF